VLTDPAMFWSVAALLGLGLGWVARYWILLLAGLLLYGIAVGGREFASTPDIAAQFAAVAAAFPMFWAGVLISAAPTAVLRQIVDRRRSPAGRLAVAAGPLREQWRRWPDKSTPPTADELRAFHDWLRTNHPGLLVSGHTRIGVLELQDIVGMPKVGASRR
jgi:hypothetical protein